MIEKERKIAEAYAERKGFKLNPNKEDLNLILEGLEKNREKHEVPYCPCRGLSNDKKEDAKKICPCFWHLDEIRRDGHCLCRLFWKKYINTKNK